ncbi:hypothetical protein SEA_ATUIN_128 [Arthrobacter phage Atuin]|nr:hypothetical protein SEA_ATUIN_227 [Arthrobacter phage Atuin]
MDFNVVTPKYTIHQAVQLTNENIEQAAQELNGTVENGILTFTISNHVIQGIAGDWLVIFGTDVHIYTDKYFQRNYDSIDLVDIESET